MDTIIYNPINGSVIKDTFAKKVWIQETNTIKRYEPQLGAYLLKKYGFLVNVGLKDLEKYINLTKCTYKCQECEFLTDTEEKLAKHIDKVHSANKESVELYKSIGEAESIGDYQPTVNNKQMTPEQIEGIPDTKGGEVNGWYGGGLESDSIGSGMMKKRVPGTTTGHFN